jgi:hypothetical protein
MASSEQASPAPARGSFIPDAAFTARGDHIDGWNKALTEALENFRRTPGQSYQVTVILSAMVEEERNPGRITSYDATLI